MRRPVRGIRLKHLNASGKWPSGNVRYYYRPKGQKGIPLPDASPDDPKFLKAYIACSGEKPKSKPQPRTGTIGAGIRAFLASDQYLTRAVSTRAVWRRFLVDLEDKYGTAKLADLRTRHIRQDIAPLPPHPANNRRKIWRALGRWWVDAGLLDEDPARDVRARAVPASDGHKPWSRADVKNFRKFWPYNTPQRLAFELMHLTCAAIGDACRIGPANVKDGWITYRRQKTGVEATSPFSVSAPDWFEQSDHFARCLKHAPRHMTFVVTSRGHSRSSKAAAQWFSAACRKAGLEVSAHGIRKHRASVFKENGASLEQRMAILGHETQSEAQSYSKSADLQRTICGTTGSNKTETSSNSEKKAV